MNLNLKKSLASQSLRSAALILTLVAIVSALGVLQYRSTQAVTEATARDMEQGVQSALFDFRHAFEVELSDLCMQLQPNPDRHEAADAAEIAGGLRQWRQSSSFGGLVSEVFLWDGLATSDLTEITLTGPPQRSPWPSNLQLLRAQLSGASGEDLIPEAEGAQRNAPAGNNPPGPGSRTHGRWLIDEQHLVLLHEFSSPPEEHSREGQWLLVPLSRPFFTAHFLPELARHELGAHAQAYQVAVLFESDHPSQLYSSRPGLGSESNGPVDASLNLFGPPSQQAGSSRVRGIFFPVSSDSSQPPAIFIDPLVPFPPGQGLTVIAQHRRGSLEAAVASLRERNLLINFGVLAILAITLAMVVIASHRARSLARMQMDFVAGVSHELRTPLTGILLAARNLEDGVVGEKRLSSYGAAIKNQASRLSGLVEEILLFAETHSGRHIYKIEPLDLALEIHTTLEIMAPMIRASGFTVENQIAPDLPMVQGDAAAFSQCLQNLITNSLKYGGDQRWIGVNACVRNGANKEVVVSVQDRGIGIESRDQQKIFEPFYRSPEVVDSQIIGNGLGLPLTKTMIEAMGGRLTLVSRHGEGSTFMLHFRAAA
jgi:signal transduction histidine kinase